MGGCVCAGQRMRAAYNGCMQRWSFPVGRVFGVEVRMHLFFALLLVPSMMWAGYLGGPASRGFALWTMLVAAVAVREIARGLAAAWFGLGVKSVLLLPTGGIVQYETAAGMARAGERETQRAMALVGPAASVAFGLTVAGVVLAVAPGVDLVSMKWVTPDHLLRALVWVNLLLGALNLLPAWPLDGGRVMKGELLRGAAGRHPADEKHAKTAAEGIRRAAMLSPIVATALVVVGMVTVNFWLIMAGLAVFLMAQVEGQGAALTTGAEQVKVREVMLTEYSILSASATLEDAIEHARHTLQDVFPVVRAGNLVGAVARRQVLEALAASGNGYVQGIMSKTFETAGPEDSLVETLEKVTGRVEASSELVPVMEGDRVVGILTPGNLRRSVGLVPMRARAGAGGREDETN